MTFHRLATVSLVVEGVAPDELQQRLLSQHGIVARGGEHCAPMAHQALGTEAGGTLRLSFGPFCDDEHVALAIEAIRELAR